MAKTKKTKRSISPEAREKAANTRRMRSVFNRYLKSLKSKRVDNWGEKIAEIEETLKKGTKSRVVPKFVGGKRVGTEVKDVPLQPADRARLIAKRRELEERVANAGSEKLREQFLEILPAYAATQGWDRRCCSRWGCRSGIWWGYSRTRTGLPSRPTSPSACSHCSA